MNNRKKLLHQAETLAIVRRAKQDMREGRYARWEPGECDCEDQVRYVRVPAWAVRGGRSSRWVRLH